MFEHVVLDAFIAGACIRSAGEVYRYFGARGGRRPRKMAVDRISRRVALIAYQERTQMAFGLSRRRVGDPSVSGRQARRCFAERGSAVGSLARARSSGVSLGTAPGLRVLGLVAGFV